MLPKRLLSVGGNFTLVRSRRAYLPPPLRTANASISAVHVRPATGKVAPDHPPREKAAAIAPVTKLRAWAFPPNPRHASGVSPAMTTRPAFHPPPPPSLPPASVPPTPHTPP